MNDKFNQDFSKALKLIGSKNISNDIERIADVFMMNENKQESYMTFQIQLLSILGSDCTPVILHFLKSEISLNPEKDLRKTYAILNKIRFLIKDKIISIEQSISNPFKLSGHLFSFNEEFPFHLISTLTRADGESIKFLMNINDGLLLMHSLTINLDEKFDNGANNIDRNIYLELKKAIRKFEEKVDDLIAIEDMQHD